MVDEWMGGEKSKGKYRRVLTLLTLGIPHFTIHTHRDVNPLPTPLHVTIPMILALAPALGRGLHAPLHGTQVQRAVLDGAAAAATGADPPRIAALDTPLGAALVVGAEAAPTGEVLAARETPGLEAEVPAAVLVAAGVALPVARVGVAVVGAAVPTRHAAAAAVLGGEVVVAGVAAAGAARGGAAAVVVAGAGGVARVALAVDLGGAGGRLAGVQLAVEGGGVELARLVAGGPGAAVEGAVGVGQVGAPGRAGWIGAAVWGEVTY